MQSTLKSTPPTKNPPTYVTPTNTTASPLLLTTHILPTTKEFNPPTIEHTVLMPPVHIPHTLLPSILCIQPMAIPTIVCNPIRLISLDGAPDDVLTPVEFLSPLVAPRSIESFPPT
eukprot:5458397-Ditylum_brightwellii.AAC.1